jgi:hypothetical protein
MAVLTLQKGNWELKRLQCQKVTVSKVLIQKVIEVVVTYLGVPYVAVPTMPVQRAKFKRSVTNMAVPKEKPYCKEIEQKMAVPASTK